MRAPRVRFEQVLRPALAIVFILTYWATWPHPAADTAAMQPTTVVIHEPACHYRVRVERGIPAYSTTGTGLVAWERSHAGTPEAADYHAAMDTCDANEPTAKWDWDAMYTVGVEFIGD